MNKQITETEFIERVISEWDSVYAKKYEQKELLRLIFEKLNKLEDKLEDKNGDKK